MIQKHTSRVSSSLKNREKVKIKPYGIELPTGKHYVHVTRLSILSSLLQGDSFKCLTWYIQCVYINVYYSNSSVVANKYEPHTTKATKWCAPSEDSDQPGHPPSLIRVFTAWWNIGSLATQWVYSWSESLLTRTQVILLVLSCCGSYIFFNFKPYVNHSPISMFLSIATQSQHRLNSVSSQCAHGKSSLARKSEVHPNFF